MGERRRREERLVNLTPQERGYEEARSLANQKDRFFRHFVVWSATVFFLLLVAGFKAALIVALGWGIGLASHAYGSVIAPALRRRWIDEEVAYRVGTTVVKERQAIEGKDARALE